MKTTAALALALVAGCVPSLEPEAIDADPGHATSATTGATVARGATTVGAFRITDATFAGEIFGEPTPDGAQVDIRGTEAETGLEIDLWMKVDGSDGQLWVHTVTLALPVPDVGAIVDADVVDLPARSVCSGVEAFDPDQWGTVCTHPNAGAVVVVDDVVTFELVREGALTAVGGSFRFARAQ